MDPGATTFKYNNNKQQQQQHHHPPLHYITSFSSPSSSSKTQQDHLSFPSYFKPQPQNPDAEISIFDAHKYFGFEQQQQQQQHQRKKESFSSSHDTLPRLSSASSDGGGGYGKNFRTRSFNATPTASSEASWNSQTGLLVNPPGSVKVSLSSHNQNNNNNSMKKKKKPSSSSSSSSNNNNNNNKKWNFCCTGTKSVRVKEATTSASVHHHLGPTTTSPSPTRSSFSKKKTDTKASPPPPLPSVTTTTDDVSPPEKPDPPRQQRISASGRPFVADGGSGGFSFPILKNPVQAAVGPPGGFKGMITKANVSPLDEDPPRDSLEVYQPTENPPTRHHHHHFNNPPGSPIARMETTDDDLGSDASSDLFELESFSTQTSLYPLYRRRDSLDEAPNARRFQYGGGSRQSLDEPPTPSVAATECYAPSEVSIDWSVTTAEGYDRASASNFSEPGGADFLRQRLQEEDGGKRKGNGGGLLLMSCRHGKAVSVGPQPVKCSPAEGGGGTQVYGMHVGGRPPRASKTTTLGNDHSSRLSLAFAA